MDINTWVREVERQALFDASWSEYKQREREHGSDCVCRACTMARHAVRRLLREDG
jgi:7-cyano-7-deazaguanine synthase in queuosine biosynthesis